MTAKIQWLGHASFRITSEQKIIYIDPWKIRDATHDADLVLVSHSHYDHFSPEDIKKVSGDETRIVSSADTIDMLAEGLALKPGDEYEFENIKVFAIHAYNPAKKFHPQQNNWLGFVIETGLRRIYYAGDTDIIPDMEKLENIDIALLPVGGTYTMGPSQACKACELIKCKNAIPYHWGDIVGGKSDAQAFCKSAQCKTTLLEPGQEAEL